MEQKIEMNPFHKGINLRQLLKSSVDCQAGFGASGRGGSVMRSIRLTQGQNRKRLNGNTCSRCKTQAEAC